MRQVNPATGAYLWQRRVPCAVMGSPSLDAAGVLAILKAVPVNGSKVFGQPVFAGTSLYVATEANGLYAFGA